MLSLGVGCPIESTTCRPQATLLAGRSEPSNPLQCSTACGTKFLPLHQRLIFHSYSAISIKERVFSFADRGSSRSRHTALALTNQSEFNMLGVHLLASSDNYRKYW